MPLWEKLVIGVLAMDALCFLWMAYDMHIHPVCPVHEDNLSTRRLSIFSRSAWCEKDRITFVPR
ncbi:MAG: hypothetical protein RL681_255 [Candidatus Parcubacteria bacterium]|jgi:hypothetical protein